MARLTHDDLRDIGTAAIRRVIGDTFTSLDLDYELDLDEKLAYRITLQFPTEASWRTASARMFEMTDAVMADLSSREDEHFPFIRLLSDGNWTIGRDVAAE